MTNRRAGFVVLALALQGCLGLSTTEVAKLRYDLQVRDAETGKPVADAEILLWWSLEFARVRTDESGSVRIRLEDRQTFHAMAALGNIFSPGGYSYSPLQPSAKGVIVAPGHVPRIFRRHANDFVRDGDWSLRQEALTVGRPKGIVEALRTLEAAVHLYAPYEGGRPLLYWFPDVAGLASFSGVVDRSIALADAAPLPEHDLNGPTLPEPFQAYLVRMIPENRRGLPHEPMMREGPARFVAGSFGICAFPVQGGATYILDPEGVIYRKDTAGQPVLRFPASPLDQGWVPLPD